MLPNIGDQVHLQLRDSTGVEHSIASLVERGPCVLVFFRGHW